MKVTKNYSGEINSKVFVSLAKRYIRASVLDVGAGGGHLVRCLRSRAYLVRGIDIEPGSLDVDKMDATNMNGINAGSYQTVFCMDMIEHVSVKDSRKIISEIKRILKPDGYLILNTMFEERLEADFVTCPDCGREFNHNGHIQTFDIAKMTKLLESNGFEIVKIKVCNMGFISVLGWPVRLFYFLKLYRFSSVKLLTKDLFVIARSI